METYVFFCIETSGFTKCTGVVFKVKKLFLQHFLQKKVYTFFFKYKIMIVSIIKKQKWVFDENTLFVNNGGNYGIGEIEKSVKRRFDG